MENEKYNILLVEDSMAYALLCADALKARSDVQVEIIENFEHAYQKLSDNDCHYDLVFIDLNLQESLQGLRLIPLCRDKNIYPVVLTSYKEMEVVSYAFELGAMEYILKQENFKPLCDLVANYIEQRNGFILTINEFENKFIFLDTGNFESIKKVISHEVKNIFIHGEEGVGKSYLAGLLNQFSLKGRESLFFDCKNMKDISSLKNFKKRHTTKALRIIIDDIDSLDPQQIKEICEIQWNDVQLIITSKLSPQELVGQGLSFDFMVFIGEEIIPLPLLKNHHKVIPAIINKLYPESDFLFTDEVRQFFSSLNLEKNIKGLKGYIENLSEEDHTFLQAGKIPLTAKEVHESAQLSFEQKEFISKFGLEAFTSQVKKQVHSSHD